MVLSSSQVVDNVNTVSRVFFFFLRKGEKETEDHLKKDCRERRSKADWKSCNVAEAAALDRECWLENLTALCATSEATGDKVNDDEE